MLESYPDVLTVAQLSSALNISKNAAYDFVHSGTIGSFRIGRKILIPKIFLLKFISSCDIILSVTTDNANSLPERN